MRYLHYKLADGTIVNTLDEAKDSGQTYTDYMEEIPGDPGRVSPKRQFLLDTYGKVVRLINL